MKNIATGDVLERIRRLAPSHVTAPFKTVAEWREWQLSEGQKRCEEINRQNRQLRVEKIQKLIPAILAILPRELRHRLCIFDTLERRALLAAQEALSTAIDAHDDAVQAVYRKAHFSGGGSSDDSVIVH